MTHQKDRPMLDEVYSGICRYCDGKRTIEYIIPLENKNEKELEYEKSYEESCKYCDDRDYDTYNDNTVVYAPSITRN